MRAAGLLALVVAGLPSAVAAEPPTPGGEDGLVFAPLEITDTEALGARLRAHVAYLRVTLARPRDQPLAEDERTGFAVALDAHRVAALAHLVDDARRVEVTGPLGTGEGQVELHDRERRVAVIRVEAPLARLGLRPAPTAPAAGRRRDGQVFALTSTAEGASVVQGVVTDVGDQPELEGHPRTSLRLTHGMPVFDGGGRFVGYARALAWDTDRHMLVPPEVIAAARTATVAPPSPPAPREGRPWWTR